MKKILFLVVSIGLCVGSVHAQVTVEGGGEISSIVISKMASPAARIAANELSEYIKRATGNNLPVGYAPATTGIPVYIGDSSELSKLGLCSSTMTPDQYRIIVNKKYVAIFGSDYNGDKPILGVRRPKFMVWNDKLNLGIFGAAGTLYGTYAFLEKNFGIRFYMPMDNEIGTVIPKQKKVKLKIGKFSKQPAFDFRYTSMCYYSKNSEVLLWARKLGYGGSNNVQANHSFAFFRKYIKTNPEYFALVDGERDFSNKCVVFGGPQLCLNNPDVIAQWVKNITEYFAENPHQNSYPVVPGDGLSRCCQCSLCSKEYSMETPYDKRFSNHIWRFINRIATEVAKEYPDKYIGALAYSSFRGAPDFKIHPNVKVMFCRKRVYRNMKEYKRVVQPMIEVWAKKTKKLYFWGYYLDHWMQWRDLPLFYPHTIDAEIKYLQFIGARGEKIESIQQPAMGNPNKIYYPGMQHLNLYVTGKLHWNPNLNIDELLEEYFTTFYGPAAEAMKKFILRSEQIYIDAVCDYPEEEFNAFQTTKLPSKVFTSTALSELDGYIDAALTATAEESLYHKRVEVISSEFKRGKKRLDSARDFKPATLQIVTSAEKIKCSKPERFVGRNDEVPEEKTFMQVAYNNETIYLKFICEERRGKKLLYKQRKADDTSIWKDDSLEIFICPNPNKPLYCEQFMVNVDGVLADLIRDHSKRINVAWNSGAKVKVKIEKNRWMLEIAIPLPGMRGKKILFNAYRHRQTKDAVKSSCWTPIFKTAHFSPERFGLISFK